MFFRNPFFFSGISLSTFTDTAVKCEQAMDNKAREDKLVFMTTTMSRFLEKLSRKARMHGKAKSVYYRLRYGSTLVILYPLVKILYISNALLQIFAMNLFLDTEYNFYGFDVISRIVRGQSYRNSPRFPLVTLCDFKIRLLGNVQRYTVQCALPINLYNEIIFTFNWFWFVLLALASSLSFCLWMWRGFYTKGNHYHVKSWLIAMNKLNRAPSWLVEKFVREYLQRDGVFILRMVAKNSSDLIAAELVTRLWDQYKTRK